MLLFWPCTWGLAYNYSVSKDLNEFLFFLLLFFLGSVLMRSAGCIVNDIVDKDLDKKVQRTKNRPLASNLISVKLALVYTAILCGLAFSILIQFNRLTIFLGLASMILAFSYPFMKRITYWPQLFLGLTFNWGIIMAWAATNNNISYTVSGSYLNFSRDNDSITVFPFLNLVDYNFLEDQDAPVYIDFPYLINVDMKINNNKRETKERMYNSDHMGNKNYYGSFSSQKEDGNYSINQELYVNILHSPLLDHKIWNEFITKIKVFNNYPLTYAIDK